jgi:hypothetical protein
MLQSFQELFAVFPAYGFALAGPKLAFDLHSKIGGRRKTPAARPGGLSFSAEKEDCPCPTSTPGFV